MREVEQWTKESGKVKGPLWILLVAAGVFGMRWDVKWDAIWDARWVIWPTTHIISRVCGELYLKSSIHVWAETFASVVNVGSIYKYSLIWYMYVNIFEKLSNKNSNELFPCVSWFFDCQFFFYMPGYLKIFLNILF